MQSKQYFTKIKNYPHEKSTEPIFFMYIRILTVQNKKRSNALLQPLLILNLIL